MKRVLPSSLLGQVMLVLALGLLVAQGLSAFLLYRAAEQRSEAAIVSAIAFRVIAEESREERRARRETMRELGFEPAERGERRGRFGGRRGMGVERGETLAIQGDEQRLYDYEEALRKVLDDQGVESGKIAVTRRIARDDAYLTRRDIERPRLREPGWQDRSIIVASIQRANEPGWLTFRVPEPERTEGGIAAILAQTLLIFGVLVLLLYLVLRRITRPLAQLTDRLADFSRRPERAVQLDETGPSDTRRLIAAHNAMEARIAALIDEKDVMLGAIGHDLKTPLAALRVRIESVPDEAQRARMAESIEDIVATLDDILILARLGRSQTDAEPVDLSALAIGVVEEFEDLDQPVTIDDPPRVVAPVQITWLKRAIRNLVGNAVRYGGSAHVSVERRGDAAFIFVDDDGPGIPDERIEAMFEPFIRGEASRNRATGGTGLGLTLARAIAEQHGGSLTLSNRPEGGLRAALSIPTAR